MKQPRDHAVGLMRKAANDLIAADAILSRGAALDMVCFHAQQAVEKSLKAMLTLRNLDYPHRHDLQELLDSVRQVSPDIEQFRAQIQPMTVYAVEARYVDEFEPDFALASKALQDADQIFRFAVVSMDLQNDVGEDWYLQTRDDS